MNRFNVWGMVGVLDDQNLGLHVDVICTLCIYMPIHVHIHVRMHVHVHIHVHILAVTPLSRETVKRNPDFENQGKAVKRS